jgi:hypothetical protein
MKDDEEFVMALPSGSQLTILTDGDTIHITIPDETLVRLPEVIVEKLGKLVGDAIKRRRVPLICERDGHDPDPVYEVICQRCSLVLDNEKWDEIREG